MVNKSVKINQLMQDLESNDVSKVINAVQLLHIHANNKVLFPLANLLIHQVDAAIKSEIIDFFSNLSNPDATDTMIEIVKNDNYSSIRQELLCTIWNSKLDYSYYLPEFVEIAAEGSFMEALECLTIIENMGGSFEERHILESQLHLKDYFEDTAPKDLQKAQIMSEIVIMIKEFDRLDDEFDLVIN